MILFNPIIPSQFELITMEINMEIKCTKRIYFTPRNWILINMFQHLSFIIHQQKRDYQTIVTFKSHQFRHSQHKVSIFIWNKHKASTKQANSRRSYLCKTTFTGKLNAAFLSAVHSNCKSTVILREVLRFYDNLNFFGRFK